MTNRILTKRLAGELKILRQNLTEFSQGVQDPDDFKTFYFLLRPIDEPYKNGYYIGKIGITDEYPAKAPTFMMLTPNGRFEINKTICLTNSHYHPESATPTWNINSMMIAFISIMLADDTTGISHIKDTKENRKKYAKDSFAYNAAQYPSILKLFNVFVNDNLTKKTDEEIKKIVSESKVKKPTKIKSENNNNPVEVKVEPVVDVKVEPVVDVKVEPVVEVKVEPVVEVKVEPVVDVKVEPVVDVKVEPVVDVKVEPVVEPVKPKKKYVKKVVNRTEDIKPADVTTEEKPKKKYIKKTVVPIIEEKVEEKGEEKPKKVVKKVVKKTATPNVEEKVKEKVEDKVEDKLKENVEEKPKKVAKVVKRVVKKKVNNNDDTTE